MCGVYKYILMHRKGTNQAQAEAQACEKISRGLGHLKMQLYYHTILRVDHYLCILI